MQSKVLIYLLHFFSKGWQISLLVLLPFIQDEFHLTLIDIGFLSMALTVTSIVFGFFAGDINERVGNRTTLVLSILFYTLAWGGFLFAHYPGVLWMIYILGGVSSGLFDPIASAIIARNAADNQRGKEMGDYAAYGDLGRVGVTPLTTFLIGVFSLYATSLFYAALTLIFVFFLCFYFLKKEVHLSHTHEKSSVNIFQLYKVKPYLFATGVGILDAFSGSSIFIFLPFLLIPKGIDLQSTGLFTAIFFLGYFLGRILLGRLGDKHGKALTLSIAEIGMAVLIISLVFLTSYWLLLLNLFLLGVVTRGTSPLTKAMIADAIKKEAFEKGYSAYSSATRTANALSRPTYSFVGSILGISSIFYLSGAVALLTIIPAYLFYTSIKRQTHTPAEFSE